MVYDDLGHGMKVINIEKSTKEEIEKHFFRAGYSYAMRHFQIAVDKLKIESGLEQKIKKYMDFLESIPKGE